MIHGDFHGLPTVILENEFLHVECLAGAGPRVVRLSLNGSSGNLLAELPDVHWTTPYGEYFPRGGHRLWHAPESFPRTCVPDNEGVIVTTAPGTAPGEAPGAAFLMGEVEVPSGIRKRIELRLLPGRPAAQITHVLRNESLWPIELAPWALTQLPLGGVAILPQRASRRGALLPDRCLALWPYATWDDPRLRLAAEHVLVLGCARAPALKVGCMVHEGWVAYLNGRFLFVKRFEPQPGRLHADLNCNAEVYCELNFLELETQGPLSRLEPGEEVIHVETWEVYYAATAPADLAESVELAGTAMKQSMRSTSPASPTD